MGMQTGEGDAMIVRSTIDLAHNLGLSVVAEGVENADILERLRMLTCDEAQGYHISRPLPVDDFLAWHARHA
jgi:EAL domain-containing protein (putative c-di-GMP-specific phosphodiesterase class I)